MEFGKCDFGREIAVTQEWSFTNEFHGDREKEGLRVLVIDSHDRARHSAILAFEETGMRVCACPTIAAAEQALRHQRYDAIVCGMIVEHLFVDEMLALLRSKGALLWLPHIAVLSNLDEETSWSCLDPETLVLSVLAMPMEQEQVQEWCERLHEATSRPDSRERVRTHAVARPKSAFALCAH
jgi:CheY-like chemotaxis protein